MKSYRCYLLLLALLLGPAAAWSQMPDDKWLLEARVGRSVFAGDIGPGGLGSPRPYAHAYGLSTHYRFAAGWSLGVEAHRGTLADADRLYADNAYLAARNFTFQTNYTDLSLTTRVYLLPARARWQPELGGGVGLLFFRSDAFLLDNTHLELTDRIKQDLEVPDDTPALTIPLRAALAYRLTRSVTVNAALDYVFTTTDHLDGVAYAGDNAGNDRYGRLALGLRLHLGAPADADGDGVSDDDDRCPLEAGPALTRGCPDTDGDGVRDDDDRCPLAAGDPFFGGCPDTDGDGTPDPRDRCPTVAGPAASLGCPPRDADGDGVYDHLDDCPFQAGPPARRGCPAVDSDGDGRLDEDDRCPERFGIDLFKGCPDTDGDGIEDNRDACPNTFGLFEHGGCPRFARAEEEAATLARQTLYFRTSSADLENFALLDALVDFLNRQPSYRLTIAGHSDGVYDEAPEYISQLRAERVKRYLTDSGVAAHRLDARGYRDRQPAPAANSPADQRRVGFGLERF